ncbi:Hypothetical predicted protein [Cloeon dipterum]|uniref:Protein Dr1 n=1 Tax=Cloeon dipterum TaxID=197152 RepID=A0A8S1CA16_9INSE|nr:Hypothetical predicted protein [Cloeon dipterum]
MAEEDELTLPRASINKIIKEIIPNIRVAQDSRELILNCCTEFIHLISSEANEICNQNQKKTINAEHVLQALDKLGFGDYRHPAETVLKECKSVAAKRRRQSTRLENLGIPEDELLRQQQALFAKVRLIIFFNKKVKIYLYSGEGGTGCSRRCTVAGSPGGSCTTKLVFCN